MITRAAPVERHLSHVQIVDVGGELRLVRPVLRHLVAGRLQAPLSHFMLVRVVIHAVKLA